MRITTLATMAALLLIPRPTYAEEQRPSWITDEHLELLKRLGIDSASDLETKGNYHWKWRSTQALSIDGYHCPSGSTVSVSRSIVLINSPNGTPCSDAKGHRTGFLKILPDGSAEPIS
jgi:hypothetical protein